jgi:hypothetical protein
MMTRAMSWPQVYSGEAAKKQGFSVLCSSEIKMGDQSGNSGWPGATKQVAAMVRLILSGGSLGRSSRRLCDQDNFLPPTSRTLECMFLTASDRFDADQPQRAAALGTKRARPSNEAPVGDAG